jgi:hypothetical protein
MIRTVRLAFIAVIVISFCSCASNKAVNSSGGVITPLNDMKVVPEGSIIYALPLTVVDIEIEAERVVEKAGPYGRFAEDLLGLSDIITEDRESWSITGLTLNTHQEPDPAEFYVIEARKMFETNVLALKRSGLILDLNPDVFNTHEIIMSGSFGEKSRQFINDLGSNEYFENKRDTLYRIINLDTAFVRIPYLVVKKQKLSVGQLAENAAVRLMELRDGKHMILTGETNVFPQDEAAINELNRLEKEYTELFTGKILKEKKRFNYQIIPRKDMIDRKITLDMFSELTGPGESEGKSGSPIIIEFIPELSTRNLKTVSSIDISPQSSKNDRLFYRMPDIVNVRLSFGNKILGGSRKLVYQFGEIIKIPNNYVIQSSR